jgi:hypothetical protein
VRSRSREGHPCEGKNAGGVARIADDRSIGEPDILVQQGWAFDSAAMPSASRRTRPTTMLLSQGLCAPAKFT